MGKIMNFKKTLAGFAAAVLMAGAASAATITETFNFIGAANGNYSSLDVTGSEGGTVTITAGTYPLFSTAAATGPGDRVARGNTWGLGAYANSSRSHTVNGGDYGRGGHEALLFDFDQVVNLLSVDFGYFRGAFDVFGNVSPVNEISGTSLANTVDTSGFGLSGDVIGLGAFSSSYFKVRSMTVSYEVPAVPLPAAGWMLFAGLGGLAAMKRRNKAA